MEKLLAAAGKDHSEGSLPQTGIEHCIPSL